MDFAPSECDQIQITSSYWSNIKLTDLGIKSPDSTKHAVLFDAGPEVTLIHSMDNLTTIKTNIADFTSNSIGSNISIITNTINGTTGNDTLIDTATVAGTVIYGEAGNDILTGGAYVDTLNGGARTDTFVISNVNVTTITDFSFSQADKIDISAIANPGDTINLIDNGLVTGAVGVINPTMHDYTLQVNGASAVHIISDDAGLTTSTISSSIVNQ